MAERPLTSTTQDPLWWANRNNYLPHCYENNALVREVIKVTVLQQVRRGDFKLFNSIEFDESFFAAMHALVLNSWECVAEPILSPNGRMIGIRLYPVTAYDDDNEPLDYAPDIHLSLGNDGNILSECGFAEFFRKEIEHDTLRV